MGTTENAIRTVADALSAVRCTADDNGAPATIDAGISFVCFVPGIKKQWWHPLVHRTHKHVFAMRPEPDGQWTLFEPWWHRLLATSLSAEQAHRFLILGGGGRGDRGARTRAGSRQPDPRVDDLRGAGLLPARATVLRLDATPLLQAVETRNECLAGGPVRPAQSRRGRVVGRGAVHRGSL